MTFNSIKNDVNAFYAQEIGMRHVPHLYSQKLKKREFGGHLGNDVIEKKPSIDFFYFDKNNQPGPIGS